MLLSKIKNNIQYELLKFLPDKLFLSYYYKKRTGKKRLNKLRDTFRGLEINV